MGELKVQCRQCGAEILTTTANRTGGLCMPCKNGGGAPEWRRRQLWLKRGADPSVGIPWYRSPWKEEIIESCQKLVTGELGCIEGAQKMAALSEIVLDSAHGDKWLHDDWTVFFEGLGSPDRVRDVDKTFEARVRGAASKLLKEAESFR